MVISTVASYPFIYIQNNEYADYEVDVFAKFCKENGYALSLTDANVDGVLAGVSSGKYDVGASNLIITPERRESVNFSDVTVNLEQKMAVSDISFTGFTLNTIREAFEKTFITENR